MDIWRLNEEGAVPVREEGEESSSLGGGVGMN
jgi:hypothetical protein